MAEIDIEKDKSNNKNNRNGNKKNWWIWVIIAVVVIAIAWMFLSDRHEVGEVEPHTQPGIGENFQGRIINFDSDSSGATEQQEQKKQSRYYG